MMIQQQFPFRREQSFEALQQGLQRVAFRLHKVFPIDELTRIVGAAGYDPSALTEWFGGFSAPPFARVSVAVGDGVIVDLRWTQLDDGVFRFGGAIAYRTERMVPHVPNQDIRGA